MPDQVRHDERGNVTVAMQFLHRCRHLVLRLLKVKTQGVKVMAFNPAGELLLIRNTYGSRHLFMLPGGGIERGETPAEAAARELQEETGYVADELEPLVRFYASPGFCTEVIHVYVARGLREEAGQRDEDEELELVRMPVSDAHDLVLSGGITDSNWLLAVVTRPVLEYRLFQIRRPIYAVERG